MIGSTEYGITASVVTENQKDTTNMTVSANKENFAIEHKTVLTNGSNRTDFWHNRLGHVSKKGLDELYMRHLTDSKNGKSWLKIRR